MYKAIFLDFYGTVAAEDADLVHRVCARVVDDLGLAVSAGELAVAWGRRFFEAIETCNHERYRTLRECECDSLVAAVNAMGSAIDPGPYVANLEAYWRAPPLHPEAAEVLAHLAVPVCCVSNADTRDIHEAMSRHGLHFAAVVTSEDVRCYKPAPAIFERALAVMDAEPDGVLHVGDSLHSDVGGAARLGIDTAWVCRRRRIYDIGRSCPTHKIRSLKELQRIVA